MLTVLLGGARSGKSAQAVTMASGWDGPVVFVATAEPRDDEMAARVRRHRAERPDGWTTVEEAFDLHSALVAASADAFVVIDCLTLWVSNLIEDGLEDGVLLERSRLCADRAAAHTAPVVAVSNEVGMGIVPADPLSRRYRDLLGAVNTTWCERAERALLLVAGRTIDLDRIGP